MSTPVDSSGAVGVKTQADTGIETNKRWVRLIPIIFFLYTIAYYDRVNVSMALPSMAKDFNLSPSQQGFAIGIFFWGYLVTFLATGWLALRVGARRIIFASLITWGFFSMACGLVHSFYQLAFMRFMLGLAEGPLWTAICLMLSQWFLSSERGRAFGLWNLSLPIGAVLSGFCSGLLLQYWNWHVMFIVGGLPAWLWAILWWKMVPKDLDHAYWLPAEERRRLTEGLAAEQAALVGRELSTDWYALLRYPAVWLFMGAKAAMNMLAYGFGLWLPSVLKSATTLSISTIGMLNSTTYMASCIGMIWCTYSSDRHKERRYHSAVPLIIGGILLCIGSFQRWSAWQMAIFILVGLTMYMSLPLTSSYMTEIMPASVAIPAIALSGGVGNLVAGYGGPQMVGIVKQVTGSYAMGFCLIGVLGILGGFLILAVRQRRPDATKSHS